MSEFWKTGNEEILKHFKDKNSMYDANNIIFTDYCKKKMEQRKIETKDVLTQILSEFPKFVEEQERSHKGDVEKRHKLVYRISNKYFLLVVIVYEEMLLKVINVIKTSKDMEKIWQKKILN